MNPFTFTYLGQTFTGTVVQEGDNFIATLKSPETEHTAKDRYAYAAMGKALALVQGIVLTDNATH